MPKRIAFCSDGTWQNAVSNTNVYRLYKALLVTSDQMTFYDDGVGADAAGLDRLIQGAFALGFNQKILDAYTKIAHVYEPGDQIYLFGFSRGAYTVRSLAGMIANCGLPTGAFTDNCVTQAFNAYRSPATRASILATLAPGSTDAPQGLTQPTIAMVGVWDTVGALGIPAIFGGIDQKQFGFLDTSLHPNVQNAFHCMAIDEARAQFPATLWDPLPAGSTQTLEQVWFTGCHGDVGGGTLVGGPVDAGTRLCDITLGYMLAKAQSVGLAIDPAVIAQYGNLAGTLPAQFALDIIRESWQPQDGPQHHRPIAPDAKIGNSVAIRIQYALTYLPANLTIANNAIADTYTQIPVIDPNAI
jgi:uncharacterized protein (DUF2235 family)